MERLISRMNIIKNKLRNRMGFNLLTAILRVRCSMKVVGKCCNNYKIPTSLVKLIGTKESYRSEINDDDPPGNESSEDVFLI